MNKEKQIEEVAKIINEMPNRNAHYYTEENGRTVQKEAFADCQAIAEELIEKGYRKINENEIVISKEEYAELKQAKSLLEFREETIKSLEDANIRYAEALELKVNKKERKETAEKIFNTVIYRILALNFETNNKDYDEGFFDAQKEILRRIDDIAKEFNIDLGE